MWENMRFRSDRENAGVVAAAFVCTIAAVGLAAAVLLAARDGRGLAISGGVLVSGFILAAIVLFFGRSVSSSSHAAWYLFGKRKNEESLDYVPRKRRSTRTPAGTKAPPTAERLQELKENTNTWVPSGKPPRRSGRK